MRGELFVTGSISPTIVLNNTIANNRLTPQQKKQKISLQVMSAVSLYVQRPSFSPESGGSVKPRTAMAAMRRQGTIRLKK